MWYHSIGVNVLMFVVVVCQFYFGYRGIDDRLCFHPRYVKTAEHVDANDVVRLRKGNQCQYDQDDGVQEDAKKGSSAISGGEKEENVCEDFLCECWFGIFISINPVWKENLAQEV